MEGFRENGKVFKVEDGKFKEGCVQRIFRRFFWKKSKKNVSKGKVLMGKVFNEEKSQEESFQLENFKGQVAEAEF